MTHALQRQHAGIFRVVDNLDCGTDKGKARLILLAGKVDAPGLVHLAVLAVQKGVGHDVRFQEAQGFGVLLECLVRRDTLAFLPEGTVRPVLVALFQPDLEQVIERINCLGGLQTSFREKLVDRTIESLDLSGFM